MSELKLASVQNNSIAPYIQGEKKSSVYVETDNNLLQKEHVMANNDQTTSLNSKNFGSTSTIRIQRAYQLLDNIVIAFEMNAATVALSDYIAYSLIKSVRYSIGSTEPITLNGPQLLHMVLEQCETIEKKDQLLRIAGKRKFTTTGASDHDIQTNATVPADKYERTFYAYLPLPFSSLNQSNESVKCLPLHLMDQSLEINITIADAVECVSAGEISDAKVHWKYRKFGDIKESKSPLAEYKLPCITSVHTQHTIAEEQISVNFNSFREGEVVDLMFHVVKAGVATLDEAGSTDKRYFDGCYMKNMRLEYNGTVIWRFDGRMNEVWSMLDGKSREYIHNRREWVIKGGTAADAPVVGLKAASDGVVVKGDYAKDLRNGLPQARHYYVIPIAEIKAELQKNGHCLGANFNKDSLKLHFDEIKKKTAANNDALIKTSAVLYLSTQYRTIYRFKDGICRLNW